MRLHPYFLTAVITFISIHTTNGCLNNYKYQFTNEWQTNGGWSTTAQIQPNFDYKLQEGWELRMEFQESLTEDIQTWVTSGSKGTSGKRKIVLGAVSWNKILNPSSFSMGYIVSFKNRQHQNHLKCVQFCGVKVGE